MRAMVRRDADRVWLEGVHGWRIGERDSSVHAAQAAIMEALGEDVGYPYLLGVSALAFRMQVSMDSLCPSSPHACCGYPCHARSSQALPWELHVLQVDPDDAQGVQRARAADLYERMSSQVVQDDDHRQATIAPVLWSLQEGETWSDAMRDQQIQRLQGAFPLEREAIEELSLALVSLPDQGRKACRSVAPAVQGERAAARLIPFPAAP